MKKFFWRLGGLSRLVLDPPVWSFPATGSPRLGEAAQSVFRRLRLSS